MENNINWFEVRVSYIPQSEVRKVSEIILVNAFNFTNAETAVIKFMEPYRPVFLDIKSIRKASFSEVLKDKSGEGSTWFKIKIVYLTDKGDGTFKRTPYTLMQQSKDIMSARESLIEVMAESVQDWELVKIEETGVTEAIDESELEH